MTARGSGRLANIHDRLAAFLHVRNPGCTGHQARNFRVNAQDLPEGWNIEGLVGLSFLRQFNYKVRSAEGRIRAERAVS